MINKNTKNSQICQNASTGVYWSTCLYPGLLLFGVTTFLQCFISRFGLQIGALMGITPQFPGTWSVFSKSISVSQLVAVPLKSSGSRTSLRCPLPAVSSWKMELSGLEGYMSRDSLTQPFVWLRWMQPDSNTVPDLQQGSHYGQILLDTHSSQDTAAAL